MENKSNRVYRITKGNGRKVDENGNLIFGDANILNHCLI